MILSVSDFVTLRNGYVVPLAALQLALNLEDRGCVLRLDGDQLFAGPRDRLTDDDRVAIRRWREHLKAVISHCDIEVQ
jgi:hypothetical protein